MGFVIGGPTLLGVVGVGPRAVGDFSIALGCAAVIQWLCDHVVQLSLKRQGAILTLGYCEEKKKPHKVAEITSNMKYNFKNVSKMLLIQNLMHCHWQ